MKKLLFVMQSLTLGGTERQLVWLANRLVAKGYDVTILLWLDVFDLRSELDPRVHVIYKSTKEHLGDRVPYIRHKFYDESMWSVRATPRRFYRYYVGHKKYDVEIAFFHTWAVKIVGGSANKKAKRLAWVHHMYDAHDWIASKETALYRQLYAKCDKVVCVSNIAKKGFINTFGDTGNLITIYNMLPVSDIINKAASAPPVPLPEAKLRVVLVARLNNKIKGQLRLINAVSKLRAEGADISLTLVGRGEDEEMIRSAVSERNAENYIAMAGSTPNPYPYIRSADLLVCASSNEGYNLTVAEAMILGTPVLSTDCSGPREILDGGKYGMLVENSEEGLFQGLRRLYNDPALLEEYRKKAAHRVDFFNEDTILKQITDLIEE